MREILTFSVSAIHFEMLGAANQTWDHSVTTAVEDAWERLPPGTPRCDWYVLHLRWFICPSHHHPQDLDNLRLKPILDSLTRKGLWADDDVRYVRAIHSEAILIETIADQRLEVKVYGRSEVAPTRHHNIVGRLGSEPAGEQAGQPFPPNPVRFDRNTLLEDGFEGFTPVRVLRQAGFAMIPTDPGIYVVMRETKDPIRFLATSPAGRFKGRDPTVSLPALEKKWVHSTQLLYVGKAEQRRGLRERIQALIRFGAGEPVPHWGGRYLWQLEDSSALVVAWRPTRSGKSPHDEEKGLRWEFQCVHGSLPFANLSG